MIGVPARQMRSSTGNDLYVMGALNMTNQDLSAILPDGTSFEFWETDCAYTRELHVDCAALEGGDTDAESIAAYTREVLAR